MTSNLSEFCAEKIDQIKSQGRYRSLVNTEKSEPLHITRNGQKLLSFGCNDYLGLSLNDSVKQKTKDAIDQFGSGSTSSRLVTGNNSLYGELEGKLSKLYKAQATAVFSSGYIANLAIISLLVGEGDLVVCDKLSHSCIIQGAKLSGAKLVRYKHNDVENLKTTLMNVRGNYKNCLIITESVFSMDGDRSEMQFLKEISKGYNSWLMVDYAHDLESYISDEAHNPDNNPDVITGTLSKSLASVGGFVSGSKELIDLVRASSAPFIFSTALPASALACAIESLNQVEVNKDLATNALQNAQYFKRIVFDSFPNLLNDNSNSQIVPLIIGNTDKTIKISEALMTEGYYVPAIKPPTVPQNSSRLRFSFSALHSKEQINQMFEILKPLLEETL